MTELYFRRRLTSIMVDNKYDRRVRGKDSGKLDMKRLPKAGAGSTKVFSRKEERKGKQYNVMVVVDCSASMGGGRAWEDFEPGQCCHGNPIDVAARCATVLQRNFGEIGINSGIIRYGSRAEVLMPLEKTGRVKVKNRQELAKANWKKLISWGGGGTNTAEALMLAYHQLKGKEGENYVIILTDGQPDDPDKTKAVVAANTQVKTMGIGIGIQVDEAIGATVINDPANLFEGFLDLISREIKRK